MFRKIIKGLKDVWCGTLEFDTEPKKDSFNPVTSGGVYDAINGAGGAKEIVYFDIDPSDPPSGIHTAIGEALSNNKLPAIRNDGKLYLYTGTSRYRYDFVGMFTRSDVGYEVLSVDIGSAVVLHKVESSLGYAALPSSGTEEHPAWAKVCELEPKPQQSYTTYGLALLFTAEHPNNDGKNTESGILAIDVGSNWFTNSNCCNASWMTYTPGSEYSKILGVKLIGKYGVPRDPTRAPYPVYKVEVWVKYYGSHNILVNALQNAMYFTGMVQGDFFKFPENNIATPQSTEPSYADTEEYKYKNFFYPAESPSVAYTYSQALTSDQKAQGRDNIGACDITNIAPDYTNKIYAANSYVIHDGVLYTNENAIGTAEDWNPAHWTQTTVAEMMAGAGRYKQVDLNLAENNAKIIQVGQKEDVYVVCTAKINDAVVIRLAEDCTDAVINLVRVNSCGFSSVQAKRGNTVIPIYGTSILTDLNITNRDDYDRFLLSTNATTEHGSTVYEVPNDFSEVELNEQGLVEEIMPRNISNEFIRAVPKKWVFVVKGRNIMCLPS